MTAREGKVVIRITEDVKIQFEEIAKSLGMTNSALGSYVIGRFVEENIRQKALQEKLVMSMAPGLVQASKDISEQSRP